MRTLLCLLGLTFASVSPGFALPEKGALRDEASQRCTICAVTEGSGPEPVAATAVQDGKTYYFCSEACKEKFAADPTDWISKFENASRSEGPGKFGALPDFEFSLADGTLLKRSDWQNKVIVVDFWATWCGPCVAELPQFVELQKQNDKTLRVLGVSYDKQPEEHDSFIKDHQVNYPSVLANSTSARPFLRKLIRQIGAVKAIPVTILVDRNGEIVYRQTGEIGEAFRAALQLQLQRP